MYSITRKLMQGYRTHNLHRGQCLQRLCNYSIPVNYTNWINLYILFLGYMFKDIICHGIHTIICKSKLSSHKTVLR